MTCSIATGTSGASCGPMLPQKIPAGSGQSRPGCLRAPRIAVTQRAARTRWRISRRGGQLCDRDRNWHAFCQPSLAGAVSAQIASFCHELFVAPSRLHCWIHALDSPRSSTLCQAGAARLKIGRGLPLAVAVEMRCANPSRLHNERNCRQNDPPRPFGSGPNRMWISHHCDLDNPFGICAHKTHCIFYLVPWVGIQTVAVRRPFRN